MAPSAKRSSAAISAVRTSSAPGGERAAALARVEPVALDVAHVVDQVLGRRRPP
jgi:hypothetical protein